MVGMVQSTRRLPRREVTDLSPPAKRKGCIFARLPPTPGRPLDVDKTCPACHFEPGGIPFPAKHPVKPQGGPMRCLFCHKLKLSGV